MANKEDKMRWCLNCKSDFVALLDWEPIDKCEEFPDHWAIELYCGECETFHRDIFTQEECMAFEEWYDDCRAEMRREADEEEKKIMSEWVDKFLVALSIDAIQPEDF